MFRTSVGAPFLLVVTLVAFLSSCATNPSGASREASTPEGHGTLDEDFLQVAEALPGFAGFYLDENGDYVVNLAATQHLHTANVADIKEAIENVFGLDYLSQRVSTLSSVTRTPEIKLRTVRYTLEALQAYFTNALEIATEHGLLFLDVDELNNTVTLGIESEDHALRVREAMRRFNVPEDAISLEITKPIRLLGTSTQPPLQPYATKSLTSYIRPVPGAVRVGYIKNGSNTWCTKGFNVRRNGELGFLVNSHCTRDIGFVDQVRFYQDWVGTGTAIGVETLDPAFYMGGGSCPPFATCRFSDAAYVRYGDPSNSGRNTLPRITTANGRTHVLQIFRGLQKDVLVRSLRCHDSNQPAHA